MSDYIEKETVIFLLGKTGVGKSSTANTIVGENEKFKASDCAQSVTADIQVEWARRQGRIIKVVDGPGLFDTDMEENKAVEKMSRNTIAAFMLCPEGFNSLVLVLKYGMRYTKEEQAVVSSLKELFGPEFVRKFCTIIVTNGDNFDQQNKRMKTPSRTFQDWCGEQAGEFQKLLEECNNRVVLFHNWDEDKHEPDVASLLETVDLLQSQGGRYTNELFTQAAVAYEKRAKVDVLPYRILGRLHLFIQGLERMKKLKGNPEDLECIMKDIMTDADFLLCEIDKERTYSRVLDIVKENIIKIRREIESKGSVFDMEKRLTAIKPLHAWLQKTASKAKYNYIAFALAVVVDFIRDQVSSVVRAFEVLGRNFMKFMRRQ